MAERRPLVLKTGRQAELPFADWIPAAALAEEVQDSLEKADTAVQPEDLDDYQPADAELTAIAAANPGANQSLRWTGANSPTPYSLTSSGVALAGISGAANAVPYFTSSTAVSTALSSTAGRALWNIGGTSQAMIYFSSSNVPNLVTTTAFGRGLLNVADAAAARTGIGLADGTYTPTITGVSNVASTSSPEAQYMRVGDTVTVSGSVEIDASAAGNVIFRISLPIASNIVSNGQCTGFCGTGIEVGAIIGNIANDAAQGGYTASGSLQTVSFHFTYRI